MGSAQKKIKYITILIYFSKDIGMDCLRFFIVKISQLVYSFSKLLILKQTFFIILD